MEALGARQPEGNGAEHVFQTGTANTFGKIGLPAVSAITRGPRTYHEGHGLNAHQGGPEVQNGHVDRKRVFKQAPGGSTGVAERHVFRRFNLASGRVHDVAERIPAGVVVVGRAGQVGLKPRLEPSAMDNAEGGTRGLIEIRYRGETTVVKMGAIIPRVYLHAESGSGSGARPLDNFFSIFKRRVMSRVKVRADS